MRFKQILPLLILFLGFTSPLFAYQSASIEDELQQKLETALESDSTIPGILLHVESPELELSWSGAAGVSDKETMNPLFPNATARIASNTKTYTAAAILRLMEMGELKPEDLVKEHISEEHLSLLEWDGYDMDTITIYHLLTHTSGLVDHAATQIYFEKILEDPQHVWTRTEQIKGAVTWGDPLFDPGAEFRYSDTGYILLGEIIESKTGKSLGASFNELLDFKSIGLESTWQETLQEQPSTSGERAHQYFQGMDTYTFHPSLDLYGGGGLVSSTKDMAVFYQQLFNDNVFEEEETLEMMKQKVDFPEGYSSRTDYRMGLFYFEYNGVPIFTHSGFWGTMVYYVPELNTSIALTVTDFGKIRMMNQLMADVVDLIKETHSAE